MLSFRQERRNLSGTSENKRFARRAAAFLLLFGLVSLSTLAKTSQYLPEASPAHRISKVSKMSASSHERLGEDVALSRASSDFGLCAPEPTVNLLAERIFLPREGAARDALKDRSPPAFSR